MKNQFFYTRTEPIEPKASDPAEAPLQFKDFTDSFNINKVIRSLTGEDGRVLVLLDDLHERSIDVPIKSRKGVVTGLKKERNTYQSEIYLSKEDGERFKKLTEL